MKVLVTGHLGYIGMVLTPMLRAAGHDVHGLDTDFFAGCRFGPEPEPVPTLQLDIRDVQADHLAGFDAVIHLAALSNDPLGNLDPGLTVAINEHASVRLARLAKQAGVQRFLFSSSCSLYGAAGDAFLTEEADFNPVTPYGVSKVRVEQQVAPLANERFSPTFLRNATAYGASPRLRLDLVVNDLVASAFISGEILIKSDGTPWRPLVHVEDIARAFIAVLHAPREVVHNQAFNVGRTEENYQIRDLAEMIRQVIPGSRIRYAAGGGPDARCYRVDCGKIARDVPTFQPRWTVREGIEQLAHAYQTVGLSPEDYAGDRYVRLRRIASLQRAGRLDAALRWVPRGAARGADPAPAESGSR